MAVLSYNEITLKKVIVHDGEPCLVVDSHVFRKQKRKPVNNTKLKNLKNGRLLEVTFHVSETAEEASLETKTVTFIYRKPGEYWFHTASQPSDRFSLSEDLVGDQGKYLKERTDLDALIFNDEIIGLKIPIKMDLKVKEAAPAVKGNTSSGALKEVTLETGATIMVPMFINEGDVININTETGEYSARAEKN
ncbi:MAG: elongation factor P [Candidatus Pacebacteria bacterium]|jgi:elongation factor P|nr:elongation factor P [Candidatus Paceibacterota bacterium]